MKIRSPESLRRVLELALALGSVVVAVTCAGAGPSSAAHSAAPSANASVALAAPAAPNAVLASSAGPTPLSSAGGPLSPSIDLPSVEELGELTGFYRALHELEDGARRDHVRVLWLGDSHSAADFLPNAVRSALSRRFGAGGPGFVHLGIQPYRHAGVKVQVSGRWHTEPGNPATAQTKDDGIFGLGGFRTQCSLPSCRVRVDLASDALRGEARWELMYRLPIGARLRARFAEGTPLELSARGPRVAVQHLRHTGDREASLKLEVEAGTPELFGAIVEGSTPGVVVDTLGINGARVLTALAWDEAAWVKQAKARHPDLVVLAYGTNEAFERRDPEQYREHYRGLIERVRSAAPAASCLLLGPPDSADPLLGTRPRVPKIDAVVRAAARELGCGYFSFYAAMGGERSFERWAKAEPPLARPDRVHLTARGYEELGGRLALRLLEEYDRRFSTRASEAHR